jgi:transposase
LAPNGLIRQASFIRKRWPWLKHPFADAGYDRTKFTDGTAFLGFVVGSVRRSDTKGSVEVTPRRWVVECTFAWMTRWRRLVRDYQRRLDGSEAMIHVAMGALLLRRVAIADCQTDSKTVVPR